VIGDFLTGAVEQDVTPKIGIEPGFAGNVGKDAGRVVRQYSRRITALPELSVTSTPQSIFRRRSGFNFKPSSSNGIAASTA